ncbi:MAG: S-layer homology domain-containing protein, partial [Oscillospiraceae bacterium]|nr:S-layer homology domain-containing protein [Oscillospiraceae bacterium]
MSKSLSLVLALIFVLGLCTIGSNAAAFKQYTDQDKVNYEEAVDVLSGLGVIEGYPDGSFNPTANVTRAEAAAMIARMMLGREKADRLPVGDVKFSDVPETNWAAKYIAFCANKGI